MRDLFFDNEYLTLTVVYASRCFCSCEGNLFINVDYCHCRENYGSFPGLNSLRLFPLENRIEEYLSCLFGFKNVWFERKLWGDDNKLHIVKFTSNKSVEHG